MVACSLFFFFLSSLLDSFTVFVFAAAHAPWEKHHLGRRRCQREPGRGRRRRGTPLTHSLRFLGWDPPRSSLVSHVRINCRFGVVRASPACVKIGHNFVG